MDCVSMVMRKMSDEAEEAVSTMKNAMCCCCGGFILFFICIYIIGWNEFNFVANEKVIMFVEDNVKESGCTPSGANVNALVKVTCPVTYLPDMAATSTGQKLNGLLPVDASGKLPSLWLQPSVQSFQWTEGKSCQTIDEQTGQPMSRRLRGSEEELEEASTAAGDETDEEDFEVLYGDEEEAPPNPAPVATAELEDEDLMSFDEAPEPLELRKKSDDRRRSYQRCTYTYRKQWASGYASAGNFACVVSPDNTREKICSFPPGVDRRNVGTAIQNPATYKPSAGMTAGESSGSTQARATAGDLRIGDPATKGRKDLGQSFAIKSSKEVQQFQGLGSVSVSLKPGTVSPSTFGSSHTSIDRMPTNQNALWFRTSSSGSQESLGDAQVSYSMSATRLDDTWTILAKQVRDGQGYSFEAYDTKKGGTYNNVDWIERDTHTVDQLVDAMNTANGNSVMMMRIFGFLLMWASLMMITRPIQELPELIPIIGDALSDAVECMLCCLTFFIAGALALFVIGIAWLAARPLVGGAMLLGCGACVYLFGTVLAKGKANKGARQPMVGNPEMEMSGAAPAMAVAQAAPMQQPVMVTCPMGVGPGEQVQVETPVGPRIVVVPAGIEAGMTFQVMV